MKKKSDDCKKFLGEWIKSQNLTASSDYVGQKWWSDGTKESSWLRRGKLSVGSKTIRCFELQCPMYELPNEYVIVYEENGSFRAAWIGLDNACKTGMRIDSGVGGQFLWDSKTNRFGFIDELGEIEYD